MSSGYIDGLICIRMAAEATFLGHLGGRVKCTLSGGPEGYLRETPEVGCKSPKETYRDRQWL